MRTARVGHFHQHALDHRQVQSRGHAVVEEGGIGHGAVGVVEIALGEGPADPLDHATLDLALHVAGVDRLAHVLNGGVAQDPDLAGLGIDVDVDDVGGKGVAGTAGADGALAGDGAASAALPGGDFFEGQALIRIGFADEVAVVKVDVALIHFELASRTSTHLLLDILGGQVAGVAGGVGDAAAAGAVRIADGVGVGNARVDLLGLQPQGLGYDHGHGGARAADVHGAFLEVDRAVGIDADGRRRLTAAVEPETGGHTAALVGALQFAPVVFALQGGLHRLFVADPVEGNAAGSTGAFADGVLATEFERVEFQFFGEFVDDAFGGEGRVGGTRSPVGGGLGFVDDHVVRVDEHVLDVVRGQHATCARADGRAGKGAGLVGQVGMSGDDFAVVCGAHLDAHVGAGARTGCFEFLGAGHHYLDRLAGLV